MKFVVINGQNHKGSTWHIGHLLIQKVACEKEIKEYFLPRDLNHFCTGCYACLESREHCPYWQEKEPILHDMIEADLLIFTSPNYCMMPSAVRLGRLKLIVRVEFIFLNTTHCCRHKTT